MQAQKWTFWGITADKEREGLNMSENTSQLGLKCSEDGARNAFLTRFRLHQLGRQNELTFACKSFSMRVAMFWALFRAALLSEWAKVVFSLSRGVTAVFTAKITVHYIADSLLQASSVGGFDLIYWKDNKHFQNMSQSRAGGTDMMGLALLLHFWICSWTI